MHTGRRAVSEIVASLVLLLIVSTLGTALYSYTLTITQGQHDAIRAETSRATERSRERFKVVAVWWAGSGDLLNVTVLNYGRNDISIADVYVEGERVAAYSFGRGEEIYIGRLLRVAFTSPVPIQSGSVYELTVVSERGVPHVYVWESR